MLSAFALAANRLLDRALLPIWLKSLGATLIACLGVGAAAWWGLTALLTRTLPDPDHAALAATLAAVLGTWLLWRIVALAVLQFFADEVVQAIEARDYPEMALRARKLGWREELARALGGAGRALLFNLLALPVALVLLVTGVGAPLVFLLVNAVLLGRELQDMVWLRHRASPQDPSPLSWMERLALGGVTAFLLTVPFANFAAPFLGAACAVHLIHRKGLGHAA
ncbi:MAG: EI24 domain-containing protein [Sphingomonadales bacterium]|nr:EI24 domain-containing protein [Sphingomonadaceae bacterium]MBS3932688.1 EI24 domain-containing protein [Sphingomonadales bacterium]